MGILVSIITLTVITFLLSAGIEYMWVSKSAKLTAIYMSDSSSDKLRAMIISTLISIIVGLVVGTGGGMAIGATSTMLATALGMVTNSATFRFFESIKRGVGRARQTRQNISNYWNAHPTMRKNFNVGVPAVVKLIVTCVAAVGWSIRIFAEIVNFPGKAYRTAKVKLHR